MDTYKTVKFYQYLSNSPTHLFPLYIYIYIYIYIYSGNRYIRDSIVMGADLKKNLFKNLKYVEKTFYLFLNRAF